MSLAPAIATTTILLAEDDLDDCLFFEDAIKELRPSVQLSIVHNGEQLMQRLTENSTPLPDIIFLDINLPRKNGVVCLTEIKQHPSLKHLPVIIYSTGYQPTIIDTLYITGAHYYIRKPNNFPGIKKVLLHAISLTLGAQFLQPPRESFVLSSQSNMNELN